MHLEYTLPLITFTNSAFHLFVIISNPCPFSVLFFVTFCFIDVIFVTGWGDDDDGCAGVLVVVSFLLVLSNCLSCFCASYLCMFSLLLKYYCMYERKNVVTSQKTQRNRLENDKVVVYIVIDGIESSITKKKGTFRFTTIL
ncbi:hypothetical protein BC829DRAFT_179102 [Chytridium lagenaria]|nr:hypothetical protein BC829DRAFT_179102 [Chytridium lagenaria]